MSAGILDRYAGQTAFPKLGAEGQKKLLAARVAIIGLGALGTVSAERLCRAGVGFIRLIDRDTVAWGNLHRQTLYTEADARRKNPKAAAARAHLASINSAVSLEPLIADVNAANITGFIADVDLVLDGSDNFELRFALNDACRTRAIPWVYGGVVAASGASMSIIPGGPCLRCLMPEPPAAESLPDTRSRGVLNMITGIVACVQAAEAVKILTCPPAVSAGYLSIDLWENNFEYISIQKNPHCPACGRPPNMRTSAID